MLTLETLIDEAARKWKSDAELPRNTAFQWGNKVPCALPRPVRPWGIVQGLQVDRESLAGWQSRCGKSARLSVRAAAVPVAAWQGPPACSPLPPRAGAGTGKRAQLRGLGLNPGGMPDGISTR